MIATICNVKIHYHVIGEGKPIFILHGLRCDHKLMLGCMEPLFTNKLEYKRIYVDLPGMGQSDAPIEFCSSDKILELLISFINTLTNENFLLVGESYGGYLARGILSQMPNRTNGLLLLCPVVKPEHRERNIPVKNVFISDEDFLSTLSENEKIDFCEFAVIANQYTYKRFQDEVVAGLEISNKDYIENLLQNYAFTFDVDEKLHHLKYNKPVLFITGRQDTSVGYHDLWNLIEDYPRATFSVLDIAGHNLQYEQPLLFECLVKEWLNRIEIQA